MVKADSIDAVTGIRTVTEDYGDGTGLRVEYDANGTLTAETPLTGLPIPQPNHVTFTERFDTLPQDQADALWALISHPDLIPALTALISN